MSAFDALRTGALDVLYGVFGDEGTHHTVSGDITRRAVISKDVEAVFGDGGGTVLSNRDVMHLLVSEGAAVAGDRWTDANGDIWELIDRMEAASQDQLKFEIKKVL